MDEKGEHQVTSKWRWDDYQRQRKPQEEKAWKESQGLEEEDERKWCAAYEDAAKKMLKYLEDSEDLKVSLRELKEPLESSEEAGIFITQNAKQARNERGQKALPDLQARKNEVYIASLARWGTRPKGLVELESRCRELMQEVELLKRKTRSCSGWHCGRQGQIRVMRPKSTMKRFSRS